MSAEVSTRTTSPKNQAPAAPTGQPNESADARATRQAALELVESWRRAQNAGDLNGYLALYEPREFVGLKRTHGGGRKRYDFTGWRKDRAGMFKKAMEVAVEDLSVETWRDPGSGLKQGLVRARFTQRWRSMNYADHGPKTLVFWMHPVTNKPRIVFEELLLSRKGWDETDAGMLAPSEALALAKTPAQMLEAMRALQPRMSNAAGVVQGLAEPTQRGLLLEAMLGAGPLDCIPQIAYEQCGENEQDWGQVEDAGLEHACVRRAIVLPLLAGPALPADALTRALPNLLPTLAYSVRDEELGGAVLATLGTLPEPARLPTLSEALRNPGWEEALDEALQVLSARSLYQLWDASQNPAALRPLPSNEHALRLAAIHAQKEGLPNELMLPVVDALARQEKRAELERLASDSDCELAMRAASALAALGDAKRLPTWSAATTVQEATRVVCMLRHDDNRTRASAELAKFFHPTHKVRAISLDDRYDEFTMDGEADHDAEGADAQVAPEPSIEETEETYAAVELLNPEPMQVGERTASIREVEHPSPDLFFDSRAFGERDPTNYDAVGFFEADGHAYLDWFGTYVYTWNGCPC